MFDCKLSFSKKGVMNQQITHHVVNDLIYRKLNHKNFKSDARNVNGIYGGDLGHVFVFKKNYLQNKIYIKLLFPTNTISSEGGVADTANSNKITIDFNVNFLKILSVHTDRT